MLTNPGLFSPILSTPPDVSLSTKIISSTWRTDVFLGPDGVAWLLGVCRLPRDFIDKANIVTALARRSWCDRFRWRCAHDRRYVADLDYREIETNRL